MIDDGDKGRSNRRPQLRVLFGGAHPEGVLSPREREKLYARKEELICHEFVVKRAELLEEVYYEHGAQVISECREYAQIATALKLGKHISFVQYQNDILDGEVEGEANSEIEKTLYQEFMFCLATTIGTLHKLYQE